MDREARDPFELMENIEEILGIKTYPMNWPIGCGKEFKGVFDRNTARCWLSPATAAPTA